MKDNKILKISIIILALFIVSIGGYFMHDKFFSKENKKENNKECCPLPYDIEKNHKGYYNDDRSLYFIEGYVKNYLLTDRNDINVVAVLFDKDGNIISECKQNDLKGKTIKAEASLKFIITCSENIENIASYDVSVTDK